MSTPYKIVIEIEGGLVTAVNANFYAEVLVIDHDVLVENACIDHGTNVESDTEFDAIRQKVDDAVAKALEGMHQLDDETMTVQPESDQ